MFAFIKSFLGKILHKVIKSNFWSDKSRIRLTKLLLFIKADPNVKLNNGTSSEPTLLHWAAENNDIGIAELLLKYGASLNVVVHEHGITPLTYAVSQNNEKMVELLLAHKVDPNIKTFEQTPLYNAVERGKKAIVELLLQYGADPNIDNSKQTPLMYSSSRSNHLIYREISELLLQYGADPNVQDYFGNTSLHSAVSFCQAELVKLLLARGANPNIEDKNGRTALYKAVINSDLNVIILLYSAYFNIKYDSLKVLLDNNIINTLAQIDCLLFVDHLPFVPGGMGMRKIEPENLPQDIIKRIKYFNRLGPLLERFIYTGVITTISSMHALLEHNLCFLKNLKNNYSLIMTILNNDSLIEALSVDRIVELIMHPKFAKSSEDLLRNCQLALALYQKGAIKNITIDYLCDSTQIQNDAKEFLNENVGLTDASDNVTSDTCKIADIGQIIDGVFINAIDAPSNPMLMLKNISLAAFINSMPQTPAVA